VSLHPVVVKQEWKPVAEWKAPEWKVPEEWKTVEEWKPASTEAPKEWSPAPVEWKAPEWKTVEWKEPEAPANYEFKYDVHDEYTGDIKSQSETAVNGAIKGQYSLIDSDGYKRIVDYTADDVHGFQANVRREPTSFKVPTPAPKIIIHEPIITKVIPNEHWW
jgi:hypothetical protein